MISLLKFRRERRNKRRRKPDESDVILALAYAKSGNESFLRAISTVPKLPDPPGKSHPGPEDPPNPPNDLPVA